MQRSWAKATGVFCLCFGDCPLIQTHYKHGKKKRTQNDSRVSHRHPFFSKTENHRKPLQILIRYWHSASMSRASPHRRHSPQRSGCNSSQLQMAPCCWINYSSLASWHPLKSVGPKWNLQELSTQKCILCIGLCHSYFWPLHVHALWVWSSIWRQTKSSSHGFVSGSHFPKRGKDKSSHQLVQS